MAKLKTNFPAIHKGISKVKDAPTGSPYNYVTVKHGVAIIVSSTLIVCFDLRDYSINYQTVPAEQRADFERLMDWLEGKSFSTEFWENLSGVRFVEIIDDAQIMITGDNFEKILVWEENGVDISSAVNQLCSNIKYMKQAIPAFGISRNTFKKIENAVGKIIGPNAFVFEFSMQSPTIRFTIEKMGFVFGVFIPTQAVTADPLLLENYRNFVKASEGTLFN